MHIFQTGRANKIISLVLGVLLSITSYVLAELPPEKEGICVRVRIKIDQDIVITRTGFRATLEINNALEGVPLESVAVSLEIQNMAFEPANNMFAIGAPELTGISDVDGGGVINPGTSAKAVWKIIPTRDAAPDYPMQYLVGGTLSYVDSGTTVNIPLFPATITVKPDPKLVLNYFLVRDVYSDDPFTPEIEPAEPFPLGLIMTNQGKGTAHDVRIISSQPAIIENEEGLLIDFEIIGTQVNTSQILPSLNVNLGDIGPGESAVVQWLMTASLQGEFIEYSATFEHIDDVGDSRISLIESVDIHQTLHAVRIDVPADDYKPDFLVNDVADPDFLPDTLYNSDGSTAVVNVGFDPIIDGEVNNGNLAVTLTAGMPNGWIYIRVEDPGQEQFLLERVVRSDGREILVDENAWTTHRTIRLQGQTPYREHRLHLLDFVDSDNYEYTLTYKPAVSDIYSPQTDIRFSDEMHENGGRYYILPETGIYFYVDDESPVSTYYRIDGNSEFATADVFTIPVEGEYKIEYYSEDSMGNKEIPKTTVVYVGNMQDRDGDGLLDILEDSICTELFDADTDNDGVLDGVEDSNQNGVVESDEINPCDSDSDDDGIHDGTELGYTLDDIRIDTDTAVFQADLDPSTRTDPLDTDSDKDGFLDGEEDPNHNGCVDIGEADSSNELSFPANTVLALKKGFNLIAIPADTNCKSNLDDWLPILGNAPEIEKVMAYDESSGLYKTLIPGEPSNPGFALGRGEGLLVYALQDREITFTSVDCSDFNLRQGFNLSGIACASENYSAFQLLQELEGQNIISIQRYSTEKGVFESAGFSAEGQIIGADFPIVAGEGYFIYMKQQVLDFNPVKKELSSLRSQLE